MEKPKALVLTGFGVNADRELHHAFLMAGAEAKLVHLNDIIYGKSRLEDFQILAFPGGFSFGDDIASGKVFANKFKFNLSEQMGRFLGDGKLVIGICNGFQMLVKMGVLPAFDKRYFQQSVTLTFNDSGRFEDRWVRLKANPESKCIFTKGIDFLPVPVRHGEGKFIPMNEETLKRLHENGHVAFQYCDANGNPTMDYPLNPNGAIDSIAGICDESGRVFGMMPHPEAHIFGVNNPQWAREGLANSEGAGLKIFRNAVEFAKKEF